MTKHLVQPLKTIAVCLLFILPWHSCLGTTSDTPNEIKIFWVDEDLDMETHTLPITYQPNKTIQQIKKEIFDQENIQVPWQKLSYDTQPLANDKTLQHYNINKGATIMLEQSIIFVKTQTHTITLGFNPQDTIANLKQAIQATKGIPPKTQKLTFNGKILEDNKPLSHYNIERQATLDLAVTWQTLTIHVKYKNKNKSFDIKIREDKTIQDVKENILDKQSHFPDDQTLLNGTTKLQDNQRLYQCGIQNNATLQLALASDTPDSNNSDHSPNHDNNNHDATSNHDNTILNNPNNNPNHDTTNQNNNLNNNENQDKDNTTTYIIAATCILFILGLTYFVKQNPVKKDTKSQDTTAPPTSPPPTPRKPT